MGSPGAEAGARRGSQPSCWLRIAQRRSARVSKMQGASPPTLLVQFPQWEPAVCLLERVPSQATGRAAPLALRRGTAGTPSAPRPLSLHRSQPLLSAPTSPLIPKPGELALSAESPFFPLLPTYPGWEKSLEVPFWITPPSTSPSLCPGLGTGWLRVSTITRSVSEPWGRSDVPGWYAALTALALL